MKQQAFPSCLAFAKGRRLESMVAAMAIVIALALSPDGAGASIAQPAAGPDVFVTAHLTDLEGHSVASERYVALVRETGSYRQPLFEDLLVRGRSAPAWPVPKGRYRLLCSASGYRLNVVPFLVDGSSEALAVDCPLERFEPWSGRVVDHETGVPIRGARVGPLTLMSGQAREAFSARALAHLGQHMLGISDDDGRFRIAGVPGQRSPVWVAAEGRAPAYLPAVVPASGSDDLGDIHLTPGGGLRLSLSVPEALDPSSYHVVLRPDALDWPASGLDAAASKEHRRVAESLWRRPLRTALPPSGVPVYELGWDSLPPGTYSLTLRGVDYGSHRDLPIDLGRLEVRAHDTTRASFTVSPEDLPPATERRAADVAFFARGLTSDRAESLEVWRRREQRSERLQLDVQPARDGILVIVPGGCRVGSWLHLQTRDAISEPIEVREATCEAPIPLEWLPAGRLSGRLLPFQGMALPDVALVGLSPCAGEPVARTDAMYPVRLENDAWTAMVPAGCRDVRLVLPDFSPVTWTALTVAEGADKRLEARRLSRGAALLVRVISDVGQQPVANAYVEWVTEDRLGAAVAASLAGRPRVPSLLSARSDARGWVRFTGIPIGTAALRATAPGHLPTFTDTFSVDSYGEVVLDDFVIPQPASLDVAVAVDDSLAEFAGHLVLEAKTQVATCGWKRAHRFESEDASTREFHLPQLSPGPWLLELSLEGPEGRVWSHVARHRLDLPAGGAESVTLDVASELFHGEILWRDEPVVARLELSLRNRNNVAQPVRTASDAEGRFTAPITEPGVYDVRVSIPEIPLVATIPRVELVDPETPVEIEVPGASLAGVVVDSSGAPVADAFVRGSRLDSPSGVGDPEESELTSRVLEGVVQAGADGRFHLQGLTPGEWSLRAQDAILRSEPVTVALGEDEESAGLRLELGEGAVLEGRILASGEPVSGATGHVVAFSGSSMQFFNQEGFRTAEDGSFRVSFPSAIHGPANIEVKVPGRPAKSFRVDIPGRVELELSTVGGRLRLLTGRKGAALRALMLVNAEEQTFLRLTSVGRAQALDAEARSIELVVPNLEPGAWSLISLEAREHRHSLLDDRLEAIPTLAAFDVLPGSTTEIRLDGS